MAISLQEAQQILTVTLSGVVDEEDILGLTQGIKTHLARTQGPLAIVIEFSESDGGLGKFRRQIGEFFAARGTRFGLCAGIAAVSKSEGQDGFLRGILSMGPMPCAYRLFDLQAEAVTWARLRLREAEKANKQE
jgi:hypothetical protein